MDIEVIAKPCSIELMNRLEELGVINLMSPGRHRLETIEGESKHKTLYSTSERFGPHKLICVTINSQKPSNFLYHNDAEDFLLIDDPSSTSLVLTVSIHKKEILEEKIRNKSLSSDDFISIICKKNDPFTSFFTMNPEYAHVETVLKTSNNPPSFYVTEPRDLDENLINFEKYNLVIR